MDLEPSDGIAWCLQRAHQSLLHGVFHELQPPCAELRHQRRHQPSVFVTEEVFGGEMGG
jgi:hypothetical protein